MRYQVNQKIWALGEDFKIQDLSGQPVYRVDGKVFSWGDKLSFQDMNGDELAFISQKLISFLPRYELYRSGDLVAQVVKEFSWLKSRFTLDVPGPNDYEITGSFWEYEYSFQRMGREVAQVSKKFFSFADTYGVDIVDGEDDVALLATVVVIDLLCHEDND